MIRLDTPVWLGDRLIAAVVRLTLTPGPRGVVGAKTPVAILIAEASGVTAWRPEGRLMSDADTERLAPGARAEMSRRHAQGRTAQAL